ncbi:signal peptidase II [Arthrobacter crystallopoietes]|uniref:signal peptidase II n=1 Tax=Crystallibacter crystallopoietes TaxID=37928 RepID=UPI001ABDBAB8|nr:signal peptidase II [Arthrobacter crystallopoietes]QTG79920.1 signal peptidase II [Arthrobacter crystallopoietes]
MSEPSSADQPADSRIESQHTGVRNRRPAGFVLILASCAVFAYLFDQLTKWWVVSTMTEGDIIPVLPPLLHWHFIRNSGAAFSIGQDYTWVFTIVMVLVSGAIIFYARKVRSAWWSVALGLLLGGALGNLTDRLFREPSFGVGHVVDFIAFPNFAIFNIADSAVVGGVILWCILTFMGIGIDGERVSSGKQPPKDGNTEQRGA